jgi:hypothetical protein
LLGLLTEDEYALWELAGVLEERFRLAPRDAKSEATKGIRRLYDQGLVRVSRPSLGENVADVASILADRAAWRRRSPGMAFATSAGHDAYFSRERNGA